MSSLTPVPGLCEEPRARLLLVLRRCLSGVVLLAGISVARPVPAGLGASRKRPESTSTPVAQSGMGTSSGGHGTSARPTEPAVSFGDQSIGAKSQALEYVAKAQKALAARDFDTARAQLKSALTVDPDCAEAYVVLGLTEFETGDLASAIGQYKRALKLQPNSFSGHYNLALAYLREEDFQNARLELERSVTLDPRQGDAAYNLGIVLLRLGHPAEAVAHLRHARTLNADRPDAAFNLVQAEIAASQSEDARRDAVEAAKRFGTDPQWNTSMGRLFLEHGEPRDAVPYLVEALRLSSGQAKIRRQLAAAYLQLREPDLVLATLPTASSADDHYLRSSALYLSQRWRAAEEESKLALEKQPDDPRFLLLRARVLQHFGQHETAFQLLNKAIALATDWPELHYSAAVSYYFERRYSEARHSLKTALRLEPNSARSLFLYAAACINEGNSREGEEYLRRAIALEPANPRFYYHLGALLGRKDDPSGAEEAFRKAIQLKADYAIAHYQLGRLFGERSHPQAAAEELETAVRYDPDLAPAYYQLSRVYARLGETARSAQALATFERLKKQQADESEEFARDISRDFEPR